MNQWKESRGLKIEDRHSVNPRSSTFDPQSSAAVDQDDPRVIKALDDYLAGLEAGQKPDRLLFLARHAEVAEALAKCLDGLEFVQKAAPQLDQQVADQGIASSALTGELATATPLGDFRIIREIGRGGMGVVYEAEQLSLGRRVALKVLPFAAALDARQLQRFKNEAQAAAHLHHTNIVPVFGIGCERGVHFYAMQFIEGQTLAQVIADLRRQRGKEDTRSKMEDRDWKMEDRGLNIENEHSMIDDQEGASQNYQPVDASAKSTIEARTTVHDAPTTDARSSILDLRSSTHYRTVANLGCQAAEALDHAHQVGVVHRDIKPANLLLDGWGKLWITDFGLARFHADAGLTLSGDLLGTLRYMSPEQAVGKWVPGDYRTDIYSLGATLYELLTLKPAFDGRNREELLAQIATEEPLRPRQINRGVPVEMETIVRKAMEKKPEERYGAVKDLADDLRRFLEDKPILAKPPTLALRVKKWSRRHKPVIMTTLIAAALTLVLVISGLVAAILLITQEKNRTQDALREAKNNFEKAEQNRRRAEANFQNALNAVDRMLMPLSAEQLTGVPNMEPLRRKILEDALQFLENFKQENSDDLVVRPEMAQAYARLASVNGALDHPDQAEKAYRQALNLYSKLQSEYPETINYRYCLASCLTNLAGLLRSNPGRYDEAEALFRQALILWKKLIADLPQDADYRANLARTLHDLGYFLWNTDRIKEAEESYRLALNGYEQLANDYPDQAKYRMSQGWIHNSIGVLLETTGRPRDAEQAFHRALDLLDPREEGSQGERNRSMVHLGLLLAQYGRLEEAEKVQRQLMRQAEDRGAQDPGNMALGYRHLAVMQAAIGQSGEAVQNFHKAIGIQKNQLAQSLTNAGYRDRLATSHHYLANFLRDTDQSTGAEQSYLEALAHQEQLVALFPGNADYQLELARIQSDRGNCLMAAGQSTEAQEAFHKASRGFECALQLSPQRHDLPYHLARFLAICPDSQFRDANRAVELAQKTTRQAPQAWYCWRALGQAQYRAGDWKASVAALEKSMENYAGGNASDWFFLAMAHWRLGDQSQARRWYDQAVKWMEKYQPKSNELGRFRTEAEALIRP